MLTTRAFGPICVCVLRPGPVGALVLARGPHSAGCRGRFSRRRGWLVRRLAVAASGCCERSTVSASRVL